MRNIKIQSSSCNQIMADQWLNTIPASNGIPSTCFIMELTFSHGNAGNVHDIATSTSVNASQMAFFHNGFILQIFFHVGGRHCPRTFIKRLAHGFESVWKCYPLIKFEILFLQWNYTGCFCASLICHWTGQILVNIAGVHNSMSLVRSSH